MNIFQAVGVAGVLAANNAFAVNLITNGDFESPVIASNSLQEFSTLGPILGGTWNLDFVSTIQGVFLFNGSAGGLVPAVQIPPGPESGNQYLFLGGLPGAQISQTLSLNAGTYDFSYGISGFNPPPGPSPTVLVSISNNTVTPYQEQDVGTPLTWTDFTRTVMIADSGSYKVSFFVVHAGQQINLVTLDKVNLSAVPLPAAVWLLGSVLGSLGFARRRVT